MKGASQSRKDANTQMRTKNSRHNFCVISSNIAHVNTASNICSPNSYIRQSLCIATWNVLSLVSSSSQLFQLSQNITQYKLDLLGITETHMPGSGTDILDNGALFIYSGRTDGIKRQGVGIALSKRVKNTLISYTPISERIITARLHSRHINISVVVAYAPTEDADDGVKDDFYQQLSDTFDDLPGHDIKLLLGDLNARVTSDNTMWPGVISKHSLHSSSNDNGTRMLDFCALHQLTIGGTLFQHKDIHKGTWRSPNGRTVTQIDHICVSSKWSHSLLDVKTCRGADIGSDHYLVRGKLRIKLLAVEKMQASTRSIPAIEHLRDQTKVEEYNILLQNRFSCLPHEESLEDMWNGFRDTVSDVSMEVLGQRPRKRRQQHLSHETKDLLAQRGAVKRRDPTSDANRSEYSRLNKLVKKSCTTDDNNWALRIASDLEDAASRGQQREVWQKIKILSNKRSKKSTAVRDKTGKVISDPSDQLKRWKEHFSELLNPPECEADLSDLDDLEPNPSFPYLGEDDGPPDATEILAALKKLKNFKSPGVDGISNEQLKYGSTGMIDSLVALFGKVWASESVPDDWSKGIIITVPKKGDTSHCSNNRGITLRSTASKLFQIIILQRLQNGLEDLLRENQCGFRRNRSCIDQLYSLRCIIHNCIEYNIPLYINFIDFKAAFDSINRGFIWRAFEHYGLPQKYIRVFQAFFRSTVSAVRHNGEISEWFSVKSGTGQGDIQGPPLFNVCINLAAQLAELSKALTKGAVLQKAISPAQEDTVVLDTDYADDMAALDNSKEGLQETTDLLCKFSAYAGLKVNAGKTKSMAVGKNTSQQPFTEQCSLDITVDTSPVQQVSHFTYLGAIIGSDGTIDRELSARIQKASGAFNQLSSIWNNRNILNNTKIRIYKAAVITILLYGCEVWNTTKAQMKRFEVFHQRCLRRILSIKWFNRVRNAEVLNRARINSIETFISAKRLRWYGHVIRMPEERLPKYLINWTPRHGKRSRGRPRKTWLNCVKEDAATFTGVKDIGDTTTVSMASDRKIWREIIRHKREFLGAGHSND